MPHNLPTSLTAFIGREREVAALGRLLAGTRLLTLVGPPGVGKTRLALEAAQPVRLVVADGIWLIDLGAINDLDLVPPVVAAAVGVRELAGRPLLTTLTEALRDRQMLLILDTCEHVLVATASLVDAVLRACPRIQIVATSREVLGIAGETTFPVPALSIPSISEPDEAPSDTTGAGAGEGTADAGPLVERVLASEAGRLFADRARAALPTFRITEENAEALALICRRLDGIPLALELAAARVTALSLTQIARRLDDCFRLLTMSHRTALPRQQTLRAALDWSHDLLSEHERRLLRRLSVFAGRWSLEAAEEVCAGDGLDTSDIVGLLVQLVEKSLVLAEEQEGVSGYRLLDTVRQYGAEKVRAAGEEASLRHRHLAWLTAVAEQAEEPLWSIDQVAWFARLRANEDNLRSALAWSAQASADPNLAAATVELGLRLGGSLWHFWNLRGHPSAGRTRILELLTTGLGSPAARAKALHAAAYLAFLQGDVPESIRLAEATLALGRDTLHPFTFASATVGMATGALIAGDLARAAALCEQGLAVSRPRGERRGTYFLLNGLMQVARAQGDLDRAITLMEEAHALTQQQGDSWSIAFALSILGNLELERGDSGCAEALQRESLVLRQAIHDGVGLGRSLDGLGWVASAREDPARAARLFGAAEALRERIGAAQHALWRAEHDRRVADAWASLPEAEFAAAWNEGRALSVDAAVALALDEAAPGTAGSGDTGATPMPLIGAPPATPPTRSQTATAPPRRASRPGPGGLSPRELEVADLIAQGFTNRRIAEALMIAEWTVDTHVRHILTKLNVRSRALVAAWAVEQGRLTAPMR